VANWLHRVREFVAGEVARARGASRPEMHDVRGFRVAVVNTRPDIETRFVLARLDAALALIGRHQPWRLAHLHRDLAEIAVSSFPCRGAYFPAQRTIVTELSFLARAQEFTPAQVASSIVHEGVHARVHRMGEQLRFDWAGRDIAREERLCRRAELAFGQALPEDLGAPVIARAAQSLELGDAEVAPDVDWTAALAAKRRADEDAVRLWRAPPPGGTGA
jgi:hypothetical protein